jgi:hypothetical protein
MSVRRKVIVPVGSVTESPVVSTRSSVAAAIVCPASLGDILRRRLADERTCPRRARCSGAAIVGTEAYDWLAGRWFVVHHIDVAVGGRPLIGIELIRYDTIRGMFVLRSFDSEGLGHVR